MSIYGVVPDRDSPAEGQPGMDPVGAVDAERIRVDLKAITATASKRLSADHLLEQFRGPAMDLEFLLQFGDASAGGHEFGLIGAGNAGYLAGVDQVLAAPEVDALLTDGRRTAQALRWPLTVTRPLPHCSRIRPSARRNLIAAAARIRDVCRR